MRRGEEGEEVKKSEVAGEGKKESAAGVKGADGQRFLPTLDSSPACARMAALPGTVPRMMRPAPGQNYPRTGFPLEGKSASAPPPGARGPRRRSHLQGWRRRQRQRGGRRGGALPVSSGTESGRWTPEVSGADTCPFLRGFRWPAARPHRSRGPWPSSAGRNPGQISAPRKRQLFVNFSSYMLKNINLLPAYAIPLLKFFTCLTPICSIAQHPLHSINSVEMNWKSKH